VGLTEGTGEAVADGEGMAVAEGEILAEGVTDGLAEGLEDEEGIVTTVVCPLASLVTTTTVSLSQQPFPFTPEAINIWPGQMQPTVINEIKPTIRNLVFFFMIKLLLKN
jgi:hypothetical protein